MLAAAAAAPGFWDWSFDPPLVLVIDLAILYWIGDRRTVTPARKRVAQRWRAAVLLRQRSLVLAIALSSPIERLSEQLFWVHMVQHVLLLVGRRPPVRAVARPWIRLWRCLPLGRRAAGWRAASAKAERTAPLRAVSRTVWAARRRASCCSRCVLLGVAHARAVRRDAALDALHALEHTLFFATALLFWKQVIPSPPLHARLAAPQRVALPDRRR